MIIEKDIEEAKIKLWNKDVTTIEWQEF